MAVAHGMPLKDVALACLVAVIWGLAFVAIPVGLESFTAPQLTALRFVVAALPALVLPRPAIAWRVLVLIGLTLFAGQFLLLFFAYARGLPAGVASVTQQTQAFFTVLLAGLFLREIPSVLQTVGLVIACCGLGLIALTVGSDFSGVSFALALLAALSWAVGNVLLKKLGPDPTLALVAWMSLVVPLPALAVSWFVDPPGTSLLHAVGDVTWTSAAAVLYIGAVATSAAYAIWARLLTRYSAASVAPFALLAPCTGVASSALVFGERFDPARYAGMALVVVGLACVVASSWRKGAPRSAI